MEDFKNNEKTAAKSRCNSPGCVTFQNLKWVVHLLKESLGIIIILAFILFLIFILFEIILLKWKKCQHERSEKKKIHDFVLAMEKKRKQDYQAESQLDCEDGEGTSLLKPSNITQDMYIDHSSMSKDELDLLGVSVHYLLNNFLDEVRAGIKFWSNRGAEDHRIYEIEDLSKVDKNGIIRKKGEEIRCPIDGKRGAAYVHALKHVDHVGPASIMLSYTWGYSIGAIIDVLINYCISNKLDPKEVYVWICCLCVNQHRVVEMKRRGEVIPFEQFREVFFKRVTNIGHVLAMMAPWMEPEYLSRVWCIFELFTASQHGCNITIEMTSKERKDFLKGIANMGDELGHINALFDTLASTNVENAKASVESDRIDILNIVKTETTFDHFNMTINDLIRKWVIRLITDAARSRQDATKEGGGFDTDCARFHGQVGILFWRMGEYEYALDMYKIEMKMVEKEFGSFHRRMTYPIGNIAIILNAQGKYEEALKYHKKSLVIEEKEFGSDHINVALLLNNLGDVYRMQGDFDKALKVFNRALKITEGQFGRHHVDTANTLLNIANVMNDQGNYEEAKEEYEKVFPIYEEKYGSESVEIARVLNNIAATLMNQGKYDAAMKKYLPSLAICDKVLGRNHPDTVDSRNSIARLELIIQAREKNRVFS